MYTLCTANALTSASRQLTAYVSWDSVWAPVHASLSHRNACRQVRNFSFSRCASDVHIWCVAMGELLLLLSRSATQVVAV